MSLGQDGLNAAPSGLADASADLAIVAGWNNSICFLHITETRKSSFWPPGLVSLSSVSHLLKCP